MNAVPFDTLKMARKLQASGMDRAMAQGVVEVVVDVMVETKKATLPVRAGAKATPNNKRIFCQAPHFVMARLVRATFRGMCGNRWPGQAVP